MKSFFLSTAFLIVLFSKLLGSGIGFTEQEKIWISQNEVRLGMYPFYPLFAFILNDESIIGLFPDLREIIKNRTGLKFKQIFYPDWKTYLEAAKSGDIDLIMPIIPDDERKEYLNFSEPIVMDPHAIVIRNNDLDNIDLKKLKYNTDLVIDCIMDSSQFL